MNIFTLLLNHNTCHIQFCLSSNFDNPFVRPIYNPLSNLQFTVKISTLWWPVLPFPNSKQSGIIVMPDMSNILPCWPVRYLLNNLRTSATRSNQYFLPNTPPCVRLPFPFLPGFYKHGIGSTGMHSWFLQIFGVGAIRTRKFGALKE